MKGEASTVNLYSYHPSLVPECRCQAWLLLTNIFAIFHGYLTGGCLKCMFESSLIYCINYRIIFCDLANPSSGILPVLWVWHSIEDITYMLFGYLASNKQPLLAHLRPAGGTDRIVVIVELTKQFVLCKSFWPDFTSTFCKHILVLFGVEIGSCNYRKLSWSIKDFSLHDEITPSNSNARFIVFL